MANAEQKYLLSYGKQSVEPGTPFTVTICHKRKRSLFLVCDTSTGQISLSEGSSREEFASNTQEKAKEMAAEPVRRANTIPSESGSDRGKCPVVRWRDVGHEGVMAFMAPLLAENRPFLMSGYWTHQVLCKDAAQRWRTFAGIKSVLSSHGLDQLRESRLGVEG